MGLIVQHEEVISGLKQLGSYNEQTLIVYATLKRYQPLYVKMNYMDLNNYVVTGSWLAISDSFVQICPVDQLGKLTQEVISISRDDTLLRIKKNLLLYTLFVKDAKGRSIEFRVSSRVLGNRQHHEDFLKLLEKLK